LPGYALPGYTLPGYNLAQRGDGDSRF